MIYDLEYLRNIMIGRKIKTLRLKRNEKCPELCNCTATGKNPSISGMRKLYWGKNSLIVIKDNCAYKIS